VQESSRVADTVTEMAAGETAFEPGPGAGWTENRATSRRLPSLELREVFAHRELVLFLALKDLRLRYKQTALGVGWAVLQPLLGVLVFSVFFGRLAHLPSEGIAYPLFVYAGFALWSYLTAAINNASQSLVGNVALVTKVYFPRLAAPLAAVLPGLLDLVASLAVLSIFLGYYHVHPAARMLLLPVWLLALVGVTFGVGTWLAGLSVRYRDVRLALPFLLQIWFFVSPIVYASSLVHGGWRYVYALNPMVGVVDGFRWSLLGTPAPGPEHLVSLLSGAVILLLGLIYFRAAERSFADVI
jgi:lipopolysaccharide transport system permease protein